MNAIGQQAFDESAGGFDHFAALRLPVSDIGWHRAFGVFLVQRLQLDTGLFHEIFDRVLRRGAIGIATI